MIGFLYSLPPYLHLAIHRSFLRTALLPEDPRCIGSSIETIRSAVPGLEHWLGHGSA